jgi:4-oxalocrotonate tautomerase
MPVIQVHMLSGRSAEEKNRFMKEVCDVAQRTLRVPEHAVTILLTEVSEEHWGSGMRTMAEIRSGAAAPRAS